MKEQRVEVDGGDSRAGVHFFQLVPMSVEVDPGRAGALAGQQRLQHPDEAAATHAEIGAHLNAHGGGGEAGQARASA